MHASSFRFLLTSDQFTVFELRLHLLQLNKLPHCRSDFIGAAFRPMTARIMLRLLFTAWLSGFAASLALAQPDAAVEIVVDLNNAILVSASDAPSPERKAIQMLVEEVAKRTRLRWARETSWPTNDAPVIVVGNTTALQSFAKS